MSTPPAPPRPLTQQDLRWLVCPTCRQPLQLQSSSVLCTGCNQQYPIVDGLPVLLPAQSS